ncbi:MAG: hypothetical protein AAGA58_18220, partial [Verrucomicrobiota bacterium]
MSVELIQDRLTRLRNRKLSDEEIVEESIELAKELVRAARQGMTIGERREAGRLRKLVRDPIGKLFAVSMADRIFRSGSARKKASQFRHLLHQFGMPDYAGMTDRWMLRAGRIASIFVPWIVMSAVLNKMRSQSRRVVLRERRT